MSQANQLEGQLIQLDSTNALWSQQQTEILIALAQVKQSIGDTRQTRELYYEIDDFSAGAEVVRTMTALFK